MQFLEALSQFTLKAGEPGAREGKGVQEGKEMQRPLLPGPVGTWLRLYCPFIPFHALTKT